MIVVGPVILALDLIIILRFFETQFGNLDLNLTVLKYIIV